jgi:hypothetical protein
MTRLAGREGRGAHHEMERGSDATSFLPPRISSEQPQGPRYNHGRNGETCDVRECAECGMPMRWLGMLFCLASICSEEHTISCFATGWLRLLTILKAYYERLVEVSRPSVAVS